MKLKLLITPSYFCKNRCKFCYLGKDREDKTVLNLEKLKALLEDVSASSKFEIEHIDLLGGELAHLDISYVDKLLNLVKNYSSVCSVITSELDFARYLSETHKTFTVNLSYNFTDTRTDKLISNAVSVPFNLFTLDYAIKDKKNTRHFKLH